MEVRVGALIVLLAFQTTDWRPILCFQMISEVILGFESRRSCSSCA